MLPGDVRSWLKGINRFSVIMENGRLILKKAIILKELDELLSDEALPLFVL